MSKRTVREFTVNDDFQSILDTWASSTGFKLQSIHSGTRLYQKGIGFLTAPMMLKIDTQDTRARLEAWIRVTSFVRVMSLFLLPAEMGIESGGFKLIAPRSVARKAANSLLSRLGAPTIT